MPKIKRLPDAELEIMNALWDAAAPLTAAELETALPGPPRAVDPAGPAGRKGLCHPRKAGEGVPLHRNPDPQ